MSWKLRTDHITIETTNICNNSCVFCPQEKYNLPREEMKMELWEKIIDELATHDYKKGLKIDTQGFGEPFLDSYIWNRLSYAREKIPNTRFFTSTNGTYMNPESFPLIFDYMDTLRTSFYAYTKDTHIKTQRSTGDAFEKALYNILELQRYKKEYGYKKPHIIMSFQKIPGFNDHEAEAWKKFWEPRADEIIMWNPHNFGGLRPYVPIDHTKQVSCGRPEHGPAYVHVDGVVSMCCWDINERVVIGDLNTQTLEEVFHGEPYKMILEKHKNNAFMGIYCYHCEQTNPDPNCIVYSNKGRKIRTMTSDHLELDSGEHT